MSQGEFLLYQTEDAQTRVQLRLEGESVWLTQKQLADLYQVSVPTINGHLRTIFQDGELLADRTIRKFRIVAREGTRNVERLTDHYNLEVILQVGRPAAPAGKRAPWRCWPTRRRVETGHHAAAFTFRFVELCAGETVWPFTRTNPN